LEAAGTGKLRPARGPAHGVVVIGSGRKRSSGTLSLLQFSQRFRNHFVDLEGSVFLHDGVLVLIVVVVAGVVVLNHRRRLRLRAQDASVLSDGAGSHLRGRTSATFIIQ
jgi:hypothetical protein